MTTTSHLIVADSIDKRSVSVLPYIPGDQVIISTQIVAADSLLYAVPEGHRLLISKMNVITISVLGARWIHIKNSLGADIYHGPRLLQDVSAIAGTINDYFDPMLEIVYGDSIYGASPLSGEVTMFNIIGYLVPTWGGV